MQPALMQGPDFDTQNVLYKDRGVTYEGQLSALRRIGLHPRIDDAWLGNVWRRLWRDE